MNTYVKMFKVLLNLLTDSQQHPKSSCVFKLLKVQYHVVGFGTNYVGTAGSSLVLFDDDNLMMMMMMMMIMMMTLCIIRI